MTIALFLAAWVVAGLVVAARTRPAPLDALAVIATWPLFLDTPPVHDPVARLRSAVDRYDPVNDEIDSIAFAILALRARSARLEAALLEAGPEPSARDPLVKAIERTSTDLAEITTAVGETASLLLVLRESDHADLVSERIAALRARVLAAEEVAVEPWSRELLPASSRAISAETRGAGG